MAEERGSAGPSGQQGEEVSRQGAAEATGIGLCLPATTATAAAGRERNP